tara:strand:+ start:1359 stop:2411 length:1053 start_codon:yes stop_codon:yes gene_type:complete
MKNKLEPTKKEARATRDADAQARTVALNELGWRNGDAQAFQQQRDYLTQNSGIKGLEWAEPHEIEKARDLFYRDGFVVVVDALAPQLLDSMRDACSQAIHEILSLDKHRVGNRGSHRYSFGSASKTGHMMHESAWTQLLDLPTVTPILTAIFDSADYIARGGGGDFCLPGATEYQRLHSDIRDRITLNGQTYGAFFDPAGRISLRDLPCPYVCCNFLMVDFTAINGPTRQIPGTQNSHARLPRLADEPEWMKLSTVCPAPAGSVLIRDPRAWHGGTPNLSNEVRAIPNAEFYAPWFREPMPHSMPRTLYNRLSEHGQHIARYIVADTDVELDTGFREDLGTTPPLFEKRN